MSTPDSTITAEPLPATALPLLTPDAVAEKLGVSRTYIYDRIKDQSIATVNLGTDNKPKLRIRTDSLQAFIQSRTSGGDAV